METRTPRFDVARLREAIQREYSDVALKPGCDFHFLSGRPLAAQLGYTDDLLAGLPEDAIASFAGVGLPFEAHPLEPGTTVLDVGSGAGMDALIAARLVGPAGTVMGIDMTEAMVTRASTHASLLGASNIRFAQGLAEALPLADASVDVIISNGVINLCPDKAAVFAELYRVLRPGGRFQLADVLLETPVPDYAVDLIHLWTDCVAGGMLRDAYVQLIQESGFENVQIHRSYDTFQGAPVEERAGRFGARGTLLSGYKPR